MISKINPCYNPNETLYVKIVSDCSYYIYVLLSYTVNGRRVSKQSPVFKRGQSQVLTFPSGASTVLFTAYNCRKVPPEAIYSQTIQNRVSSCYKLRGSAAGHVSCIQIPC